MCHLESLSKSLSKKIRKTRFQCAVEEEEEAADDPAAEEGAAADEAEAAADGLAEAVEEEVVEAGARCPTPPKMMI